MAPKKKQSKASASKSQDQVQTDEEHLSVKELLWTFEDPLSNHRLYQLEGKQLSTLRHINQPLLIETGLWADIERFLKVGRIHRIFDIQDEGYLELTVEFLASIRLSGITNIRKELPSRISFRAGQVAYNISLDKFARALGVYDDSDPPMHELAYNFGTVKPKTLWKTYTDDTEDYNSRSSKASHLRSRAMRYLHMVMAHSINGRGHSWGHVNSRDLFYIHCMLSGTPMNLAHGVLCHFFQQLQLSVNGRHLHAGPYVTRLLRGLNQWRGILTSLHPTGSWKPLGLSTMRRMELFGKDNDVPGHPSRRRKKHQNVTSSSSDNEEETGDDVASGDDAAGATDVREPVPVAYPATYDQPSSSNMPHQPTYQDDLQANQTLILARLDSYDARFDAMTNQLHELALTQQRMMHYFETYSTFPHTSTNPTDANGPPPPPNPDQL